MRLALRIWVALVAQNALSAMSALIRADSSYCSTMPTRRPTKGGSMLTKSVRRKFLTRLLGCADRHPDFNSINELPPNTDPNIARDAGQLKDALAKCAIGTTKFRERFPRAQLTRMVKRDLEILFKKDPRYREHVRGDVPAKNVKEYGSRGRTSSKGTFTRADYDGLVASIAAPPIRRVNERKE